MAGFSCDATKAQSLLPGNELHAVRLPSGRAVLVITVIDYRTTDIGRYVEFSIAVACTRGESPVSLLSALTRQARHGTGQLNLDFRLDERSMSSQYDLDGRLCMRVTVRRPRWTKVPLRNVAAVNWAAFRGLLMKSSVYFSDRAEVAVGGSPEPS